MSTLERVRKPSGNWAHPQPEQVRLWLVAAGPAGIHSFDMRGAYIGNPSERNRDLVALGVAVSTQSEARNGANGSRFWLAEHAPSTAHPVTPSNKTSSTPQVGSRDTVPPSVNEGAGAGSGHPAPVAHSGIDLTLDGIEPCGPAWSDPLNPYADAA